MKNRISIVKRKELDRIEFYLTSDKGTNYMFSQRFSKGVYDYFRAGRFEHEILSFSGWDKNPRLDKTIEKLPMYIRYTLKYAA